MGGRAGRSLAGPEPRWTPRRAGGWAPAALKSGSVTDGAGWVESWESNSFHTYLVLVTVAETLRGVTELMRYLRKCIFLPLQKIWKGREGSPVIGSFHTRKLSFFPSEMEACSLPLGGPSPLFTPKPQPRAPGSRPGHSHPKRGRRRGREDPPSARLQSPAGRPATSGASPWGDPVILKGRGRGWRMGAAPGRGGGHGVSPGQAAAPVAPAAAPMETRGWC